MTTAGLARYLDSVTNSTPASRATARGTTAIRLLGQGCALLSMLSCATAAGRTAAPSRVSVTFVAPERFTDARDSLFGSRLGTARILADLERYLRDTAA